MPIFELKLQKTYYEKGFFNVTVDYDRFVRSAEGALTIELANTGQKISGRIDRHANQNGSARIFGGSELRDWFQRYFRLMDTVEIDLSSQDSIRLLIP